MEQNQSKCTGNCMSCTILQRQYCASQLAYSNMRMLEQVQKTMAIMQEKIDALQNNEALLIDPTERPGANSTGVGAEPEADAPGVAARPEADAPGVGAVV